MELHKLKTIRTAFLILLGMLTWNSVVSWWSNWLTLALIVIDILCVLITFAVTKKATQQS
ncbi:MAG: hypothetical protein MJ139_06240 [Limosilactobacillus sp.]|nr:hypothetical protein [Limosilactobacillus sp.]